MRVLNDRWKESSCAPVLDHVTDGNVKVERVVAANSTESASDQLYFDVDAQFLSSEVAPENTKSKERPHSTFEVMNRDLIT